MAQIEYKNYLVNFDFIINLGICVIKINVVYSKFQSNKIKACYMLSYSFVH